MRSFSFTPAASGGEPDFVTLDLRSGDGTRTHVLPAVDGIVYRVVGHKDLTLSAPAEAERISPRAGVRAVVDRIRAHTIIKRKKVLRFDDCDIFPLGTRAALRAFYAITRHLRRAGYPLDGETVRTHPELILGWRADGRDHADVLAASGADAAIAIVVHVYYAELWPEIAAALARIERPFALHVTTPWQDAALHAAIRRAAPAATLHVVANRGRDVAPFLQLLEAGHLESYAYICKLHTKKSADGGRNPHLGALWRNRLLFDLVAAPGAVDRIIARFDTDDRIGVIGSATYRFPNSLCDAERSWGDNRARVLALAGRMGIAAADFRLDFFCGSMFWVRRAALEPLRLLRLAGTFDAERGLIDGALEHAVERIVTTSALAAGYEVHAVAALPARQAGTPEL